MNWIISNINWIASILLMVGYLNRKHDWSVFVFALANLTFSYYNHFVINEMSFAILGITLFLCNIYDFKVNFLANRKRRITRNEIN